MSTVSLSTRPHTPALSPMLQAVERRGGLSYDEFVDGYRRPNRPLIFTDLTRDWPALGKFTPAFFRTHYGEREIVIGAKKYSLAHWLDLLERSTPEQPAPYPCKLDLRGPFADLAKDAPRPQLALPDRTHARLLPRRFVPGVYDLEVFIGGPGGEFPYLHYDYLGFHAYINQVYGEKEFYLYPPGQEQYLYIDETKGWVSRVNNVFQPDLERFPLFAKAQPHVEVLHPGETLFIPFGWWHTARSKTVSISVAFDQLCATNWAFFTRDVLSALYPTGWKRAAVSVYLWLAGAALSTSECVQGWR